MGVRGLYTFINQLPGSFTTVNIFEEIQEYQRQNGCNPVILINLWTMSTHMKSKEDVKDVIVGSSLYKVEKKFEDFLQKLKNAGADMIFVIKKGDFINFDFLNKHEDHMQKTQSLVEEIKNTRSFARLNEYYTNVKRLNSRHEFPVINELMLVMCQVAKRYGKLHGRRDLNKRYCTSQVELANERKAFAILGLNTHYIFYEGSWRFWSDADLDFDEMSVRQYDKGTILKQMNLTVEKAPLFVTLAGGLDSSEENVKKLIQFFKPWTKQLMNNVSRFVNLQQFPLNDVSLKEIIIEIFGSFSSEVFKDFQKTMNTFDVELSVKTMCLEDGDDIMEMTKNDYTNLAEELLENASIFISPVYTDLSEDNKPNISDLVIPLVAKTAGILLKNSKDRQPRTVVIKKSLVKRFAEEKFLPNIPKFDVPQLKLLVAGSMALSEKFKLLKWMFRLDLPTDKLKAIPNAFIIDVIICLYLVKNKAMTESEAECLLQSIVDVHDGKVSLEKYPEEVSGRAFHLGFVYLKLFFFVHSCTAAVGLKIFQNDLKFDGCHFQIVFGEKKPVFARSFDVELTFNKLLAICVQSQYSEFYEYPSDSEDEDVDEDEDPSSKTPTVGISNEQDEEIEKLFKEQNFQDCLKKLISAEKNEKLRNYNRNFKIECLLMLDKYDEAGKILKFALKQNPGDANLIFLQGLNFYYKSDMKNSIMMFKEASKISTWMTKAKVQRDLAKKMLDFIYKGFAEVKDKKFEEARKTFNEALAVDPSNKSYKFLMLFNLGMSNFQLNHVSEAFENYSEALRVNENDAKCLLKRAEAHLKLEQFEDCVIDCEESLKLEESESAKKTMNNAKSMLKNAVKRSSHEVLAISKGAPKSEVKKAFHKLSLLFHVDKHPLATAVEKLKLNRKFREIKAAYDTLN